jgi:hydroxymethylpyrimidine pyrophosphatase-like HAD family hydrolase
MGNAIEKVKNASNYITDDIDNDGIYKAMKYFKLI